MRVRDIKRVFLLLLLLVLLSNVRTQVDDGSDEDGGVSAEGSKPTNEDEERLAIDMFKGYNHLIHPSPCNNSTVIYVEFGVAMILLINVDEKNQIMQTNVWLTLKWNDCQFHWDPVDYGGLQSVRVPPDKVWVSVAFTGVRINSPFSLPDIVLFNNADGNYEVSYLSNVMIDYKGNVMWVPPAIYKSSCRIGKFTLSGTINLQEL